jgi:hypothetical protein
VVSDLGYCALERTRTPLGGEEVRRCWEHARPASPGTGLFAGLEASEAIEPPDPSTTTTIAQPAGSGSSRPPLRSLEAAAWRESPELDLVEAPRVEPAGRLMSEITRRLSTGD